MLGQQTEQFHAGVAGTANDACLDHVFSSCKIRFRDDSR
jgi:hypothetical protein